MGGRSHLHPVEVDELVKRYGNGESVRQVASALGAHRTTVSGHLERRGIPRRGFTRSLTDEQCVDIAKLYRSGKSMDQIDKEHGPMPRQLAMSYGSLKSRFGLSGGVGRDRLTRDLSSA